MKSLETNYTSDNISSSNPISNRWNKFFIEVRQQNVLKHKSCNFWGISNLYDIKAQVGQIELDLYPISRFIMITQNNTFYNSYVVPTFSTTVVV